MTQKERITPEEHRDQIQAYRDEHSAYATFASVLRRVLQNACKVSFPEALVQSRPKSISSFAEKCARKYAKYPDAVHQMTDLCGGRVIVQTVGQVESVKQFIEANFEILEKEDKGLLLSEDKFGYRDMHYIIRLRPDRSAVLGVASDELAAIGDRRAEIQVRTWLQHAWADTLHDRMYKTPLNWSAEVRRTGGLLAALMEEGDRTFDRMADELDGMIANYTAFAGIEEVRREIEIQALILENEPHEENKPALARKLAHLLAACGEYARVVEVLEPYADVGGPLRCGLLQDLGYALCKVHRDRPTSPGYSRGRALLQETLDLCCDQECLYVPHLRRQESFHARALARLGWAAEVIPEEEHLVRKYLREALEHEPENPYYLANMLGREIADAQALPQTIRTVLWRARQTCREHALAGTELPNAMFTAGRLSLLLDEPNAALGYYARGIRHVLDGRHCQEPGALDNEAAWLRLVHRDKAPSNEQQWIYTLLGIAAEAKDRKQGETAGKVLIVAGGAASLAADALQLTRPLLQAALESFEGEVVSGGTTIGVPGCVGQAAEELAQRDGKRFKLTGYLPRNPQDDGPRDPRYDRLIVCDEEGFSPEQVLRCWSDLVAKGTSPQDVLVLGFGGGPISAVEYWVALALGAPVGIVCGFGGVADDVLNDPLWSDPANLPNLLPLPCDRASVRAFVTPAGDTVGQEYVGKMGKAFHENYLVNSTSRLPPSMKPWDKLDATYREANFAQARYAVQILEACGFRVIPAEEPIIFEGFTNEEIERMAELEHGRWNVDRLRNGWRYGKRDDPARLHNCIVAWPELPDEIKQYDRWAVISFPQILAEARLEVRRAEDAALP